MITIRASSIGHPCPRKIWFSSVAGMEEEFDKRTLRIFDVGSCLEGLVVKWLREDGWIVDHNEGSQDAEIELVVPITDEIEIRGHHDAIIWRPEDTDRRYMVDIKTMNDRAWTLWKRQGTLAKYPQYAQQVHCYALPYGIKDCAIVGMNKDKSLYDIESFPFDEAIWQTVEKKALLIGTAKDKPEIPDDLPSWCCSYCSYGRSGICDGA